MKMHYLILGTFFLLVIAGNVFAASFDCEKATSEVEKLICGDEELSKLDDSLNRAYLLALKRKDIKAETIENQKQWLKNERDTCRNAGCIKAAYETRIKELGLPEQQYESKLKRLRKSDTDPSVNEQLLKVAEDGSLEQVKTLLAKGADVNAKGNIGVTALMSAARSGNLEVVKFLIDKGADVNAKDKYGQTALTWAAMLGKIEAVKLLIDKRADVNAVDIGGRTVLMASAESGNLNVVKVLIDKGADVNGKGKDSQTALMEASKWGEPDVVKLLIEKWADVDAGDADGRTALMTAASTGHLDVVTILLSKGARVNAKTKQGATALMAASWMGYLEVVKLLIDKGADVNDKGETGQTALMYSVVGGNLEIVKLLIDKGADVNGKNKKGETALSLASVRKDRPAVVQYLKELGATSSIAKISETDDERKSRAVREKLTVLSPDKPQTSFCKEVSKLIKDETIDKHMPEYQDPSPDPRGADYLNLDIDGDGIADKVTVNSGSESSYLVVQLSSGGQYDLDEGGFIIIVKIKEQIYALVTYWEWHRQPDGSRNGKKVANRLYKLTKQEAERVCDEEDLKKR
jgi:ankyrin repeat protein